MYIEIRHRDRAAVRRALPSRPPCPHTEEDCSDGLKKEPHSPVRIPAPQAAIRAADPGEPRGADRPVAGLADRRGRQLVRYALSPHGGLVPYTLANGGTGWLLVPGATGVLATQGSTPKPASGPAGATPTSVPGAIMGGLPVASPLTLNGPQQSPGPAGYIPSQIQTAYGLSSNGGYNNNISFAGIKGDGAGQTIGIFEEGYNPAFVNSTDPNYAPAPCRSSTRPSACPTRPA